MMTTSLFIPTLTKEFSKFQYNSHQKGEFNLNIVDAKGKVVYKDVIPQFNGTYTKLVDLGRKAKGVYFLEITSETEKRIKKIILE